MSYTEDEYRDLIERTSLIQEMAKQSGWRLLQDRATHDISYRQRELLSGRVVDMAEYKELIGWLRGATYVLGLPDTLQSELDNARETVEPGGEAA